MSKTVRSCKILAGVPAEVEEEVNRLLAEGWEMDGELFPSQLPSGTAIVVQCMVLCNEPGDVKLPRRPADDHWW